MIMMNKRNSGLIIIFIFIIGSLSLLICHTEGFDQQQNNYNGFYQTTSTLQNSQKNISRNPELSGQTNSTSFSVTNPEAYIYLPKSDYTIGEVINISGLTTIPPGQQLYMEIFTADYHHRSKFPDGKSNGFREYVTLHDTGNESYSPFFITVNTTMLLPGDWYIVVSHIDRKSNATYLNSTTFVLHGSVSKQSGSPVVISVLIVVSALGLVLFRRR